MNDGETYLDIVWKQFKKNRPALWSLWLIAPLALVALFAPLISSSIPLVYIQQGSVSFPWFRALFNTEQAVDFYFNMAMLAFFPWLVWAIFYNRRAKRRGVHGPQRAAGIALRYAIPVLLLCALFSIPQLRPAAKTLRGEYLNDEFKAAPGEITAWHTPLPFDPTGADADIRLKPPGFRKTEGLKKRFDDFPHVLGTQTLGRDVLTQLIYGARLALTVGIVAAGLFVTIGIVLGSLAGYFGGWCDILISRLIEIVIVFPQFFLILTLVNLLGSSIYIIMGVFGLLGWTSVVRLTRGEVLKQRTLDYTTAAQALGVGHMRIIFRHVLPNALGPALVSVPFGIANAIINEAGLSLLGFGVPPPAPSWGSLLREASENYDNWWLILFPSLAIFFTVTVFNLVGSGLRDAMDPRLKV